MKKIITAIAAAGLVTSLSVTAADASSGPYVDAHATGWSRPQVEPTLINVGSGCAPQEHSIKWSSWGPYTATGTSPNVLYPPNCTSHPGTIYLGRPRLHSGREWFTRMTMRSNGSTFHFQLNSLGYWDQV